MHLLDEMISGKNFNKNKVTFFNRAYVPIIIEQKIKNQNIAK